MFSGQALWLPGFRGQQGKSRAVKTLEKVAREFRAIQSVWGDWASVRYGHNVRIIVRIRLRSPEPRVSGRDGRIAVRLRKTDLRGGGDSIT